MVITLKTLSRLYVSMTFEKNRLFKNNIFFALILALFTEMRRNNMINDPILQIKIRSGEWIWSLNWFYKL